MDGGESFAERAGNDATLKTLLLTKASGLARVEGGWPESLTEQSGFPRITFSVSRRPIRPGVIDFDLEVQAWVWPSGENGGSERMEAIDARLLELFDEARWTSGDYRWNSLVGLASDHHFGSGRASLRSMVVQMRGSVAA